MQPFNISKSATTNDGRMQGLGRRASAMPSWRRRFPTVAETAGEAEEEDELGGFDPANLLTASMRGWQDRTLSIQTLRKSRTVAASGDLEDSLLQLPRNTSVRSRLPPAAMIERVLTKDKRWAEHLGKKSDGGAKISLPEEYYSSLAVAPHASLIFLIVLYHQVLCSNGLKDDAAKIAGLLEGIREAEQAEGGTELKGMDLLLKDGLLELYLRIEPHFPPVPSQIVKFKSLDYTTNVLVASDKHETILSKVWQVVWGPIGGKKRPNRQRVLKDVTGYLMPGTLTLVLGPPSGGKSSLHSVLAGILQPGASLEGSITYNNEPIRNVAIHRLAALMGQIDVHLPLLTIRETLQFATECLSAFKTKHYGPELMDIMGDALKFGQDPKLELNMIMMGLKHVANRIVGNAFIPSITEDERHRLTAAEMFSGMHAVYFFDQLNTIAEDSITFDLLTAIRIFTRVRQITFVASLLQPSSDVFDLFDQVIVLNQGQLVYQGPRQDALSYFEGLGYKKPNHLSTGEFLQEVTTIDGVAYLQPEFRKLTLEDFVISYKSSCQYRDVLRVVNSPELVQDLWVQGEHPLGVDFSEYRHHRENTIQSSSYSVSGVLEKDGSLVSVSMDHTSAVQSGDKVIAFGGKTKALQYLDSSNIQRQDLSSILSKVSEPVRLQLERRFTKVPVPQDDGYVLGIKDEVSLLTKREWMITMRNVLGLKLRVFQILVMSLFIGFYLFRVKYNGDQRNMNLFRSAFFVTIINMTMFNVGQLPALMDERNVYYKQKTAHFYRPISYLLGKFLGSLPFSLAEGTVWAILVFFLTGMTTADGGWHFFVYYAVVILTVLNGASMVRFFSFYARDKDMAGMLIGTLITFFILFAGYLLPRLEVPKYWIWMYYINPLQWAITAMAINEYNSGTYRQLCRDVPNFTNLLPQCIGVGNERVGLAYLHKGQFYTEHYWIAISLLALAAWLFVWNFLTYLCLSKIHHSRLMKAEKSPRVENTMIGETVKIIDVELSAMKLSHVAIPVTLSWHELSYDIIIPAIGKPRNLVSYASGWGEPTDMVGIFGSEGGGTTALLNCLAGRKVLTERITGQILVNSFPKVQKHFRHVMGYVDKIDAYSPYLTVRETIAYTAALRLGKTSSKLKQDVFVEEVLALTDLKYAERSLVYSLQNDINSEPEKRLAIATELVANPSVLFMEDPTKGLDSSSARRLMNCLQLISKTGRLVIVSLNYPSQRILSMCTKVQILKNGGEPVYFGPVGSNGELIRTYFEGIPGAPLCPPNKGVASYAVGLIGGASFKGSEKDYAFEYRVSELALRNHVHLQHLRRSRGKNGQKIDIQNYGARFSSQLYHSIMTVQWQYYRNVNYSWGRMMAYLITSIILGSVFYKIKETTTIGTNSRAGAIFISLVLIGIPNAQTAIPNVLQMRAAYLRERALHQTNVLLYNIAYTLAEIPYLMISNLIFCSIFLPMTNIAMQSASHFLKFWFLSLEFYVVVTFFGMFLAVVSPMPQIAAVMVPIIVGIWISTGGLVVPVTKILKQFLFIFWTNPLQYALDGLTITAFYCDTTKPACLNSGLCDCPRLSDTEGNPFVWDYISRIRSLHPSRVPYDMVVLLLFAILFRVLTILAFKYTAHYKRT